MTTSQLQTLTYLAERDSGYGVRDLEKVVLHYPNGTDIATGSLQRKEGDTREVFRLALEMAQTETVFGDRAFKEVIQLK